MSSALKIAGTYNAFLGMVKTIYSIKGVINGLEWDQRTYMPPKGTGCRATQIGALSTIKHGLFCEPELGRLLNELSSVDPALLSEDQRINISLIIRERDRIIKIPPALAKEKAEVIAQSYAAWRDAYKTGDFSMFSPFLNRIVDLKKKEVEFIGFEVDRVNYDVLLDEFEPDATVKFLNPIMLKTRDIVLRAMKAIQGSEHKPKTEILTRYYNPEKQEKIVRQIMEIIGFDFEAGRLDTTVHPFCADYGPTDVRITNRYYKNRLTSPFETMHEGGHGLYAQGFPLEHLYTPRGEYVSMGIHESQSRLYEIQIGRSYPFWEFFFPKLKEAFTNNLSDVSLEDFYFAVNEVKPSLIRVEADEVSYQLYIILRYEIEQALFNGEVEVKDLPEIWNTKMQKYLGIEPKNNSEGVLQDIQWSMGHFGYFPTYLLGNLYAAQFMSAMKKDLGDLDGLISTGNLLPVLSWLREKIHNQGRRYTAQELVKNVTGEELNPAHFEQYLKNKYGKLYGVSW